MRTLWLFGHQLSTKLAGFQAIDRKKDTVLMIEAISRSTWSMYNKKKLVLIFSAMRHFANELKEQGYKVDYLYATSFQDGWNAHNIKYKPKEVFIHNPTDARMRQLLEKWQLQQQLQVTVLEESLFIVEEKQWEELLPDNKTWFLDHVYRKLRTKFNILMDDKQPIGGKWNYDAENRKRPKKGLTFVEPLFFPVDDITQQVINDVNRLFPNNPGTTEDFMLPVTVKQADEALEHFIQTRLATFGDYQDAMLEEMPYMSHSLISSAFNIGLLDPLAVIKRAEQAYYDGIAPLAAVEGFIRQVLGWREYIRGVYLRTMPAYKHSNKLQHHRELPNFFWDGETNMNCLKHSIYEVLQNGYNHHIQRLMVIGNFANLARINPQQVAEWFNAMYTDAHDWVVLPNVLGMALYADGGVMSTKPYISSGQYINKMSNYCKNCRYKVNNKFGEDACPFNSLYWDFLMHHKERFKSNPRMTMMYRLLDKMHEDDRKQLRQQASKWFDLLEQGKL